MSDLAEMVRDTAEAAVEHFQERCQGPLDYSEASLSEIESLLDEASDFVPDLEQEQVDSIVQLVGAYILEVGQRQFGGKFFWHEDRNQPVLVVEESEARIAIMTFDKVRSRLSGDEADHIPFFYQGFAERIRNPEPGSDVLIV